MTRGRWARADERAEAAGRGLTHVDDRRGADGGRVGEGGRRPGGLLPPARFWCRAEVVAALRGEGVPKGDALAVARIAGIMGAKQTPDWSRCATRSRSPG